MGCRAGRALCWCLLAEPSNAVQRPTDLGPLWCAGPRVSQGCEPSIGWSVLLSVMLHEIPQEVGDYCALVKLGMSHWVAVGWNCLSSLAAFIGAWFVLGLNSSDEVVNSYLIAFSAVSLGGCLVGPGALSL